MESEDDPNGYSTVISWEEKNGKLVSVKFIGYCKNYFTLEFTTDKGKVVMFRTGGDRDDIYRYDPLRAD